MVTFYMSNKQTNMYNNATGGSCKNLSVNEFS